MFVQFGLFADLYLLLLSIRFFVICCCNEHAICFKVHNTYMKGFHHYCFIIGYFCFSLISFIDITELCKRSPLVKLENIPKIHKMLCSATARWYNIGIMLGVDINKLTEIEMDNVTVLSRLLAVIKRWLHQDINTAWIKLANVMGSKVVNRLDIKKEIMELIECKS